MDEGKALRTGAGARAGNRGGAGGVRAFVVQRIVEGKERAQRGRERGLHRGAETFL